MTEISTDPSNRRTGLGGAAWITSWLGLWGSLLALVPATLCTFGASQFWAFELSTHFEVQYLIGSVLALVLAAMHKNVVGLGLAIALCGVHGPRVLHLQGEAPFVGSEARDGPALRLLLCNVQARNADAQPLLELIASEDPDVLCLIEVDRRWLDDLHPLEVSHPHFVRYPRDDNFGIAMYSKLPFVHVERVELGTGLKPSIHARVEHGGQPLEILTTHPVPPVGSFSAHSRDVQIQDLATLARQLGSRTVIAGDLNATPWTPVFQDLLVAGNVRDSMQGHGVHATWPARWPTWLRIPIDHVLLGTDVAIEDRRVGPYIGSDHRPVIVDLR